MRLTEPQRRVLQQMAEGAELIYNPSHRPRCWLYEGPTVSILTLRALLKQELIALKWRSIHTKTYTITPAGRAEARGE
jgi:DNA-binding PadR family transcriptional regulator